MAEWLISNVKDQLSSILWEQVAGGVKIITGVDGEVKKLTNNLKAIQAVIEDAERRGVQDVAVKKWLQDLKDVSYDIDDLLDEWNIILKQKIDQEAVTSVGDAFPLLKKPRYAIGNLSSNFSSRRDIANFSSRRDIAGNIRELNGRLDEIADQRNRYNFKSGKGSCEQRIITTSIIDVSEVFVREEDERKIKEMLLCESSAETKNISIISVVGMGGIGKTTLARLAYNDAEVKSQFDVSIWVCVSDHFEEERIAVEILESLLGQKPILVGRENILQDISKRFSGKKFLLVLDDVWTEDSNYWEQLKASLQTCSRGSRILVTTRKQLVAMRMGSREMDMFFLSQLPDEKCWSLFSRLAFFDRPIEECRNLDDIGRKIVRKCKGLPLAVKVVGGLLRFRKTKEEWQCILDSEIWEIYEVENGVFPPLLLSYYDLPPVLKQCFSYCAIFPKDHQIEKKKLIYLWMSQGFLKEALHKKMEVVGEKYFNKLAMLSFFQDFEKDKGNIHSCKMHDIVHDFAQFLTARECLLMEIDGVESQKKPYFETIRHLTITRRNDTVGISMEDWKKLRTLSIKKGGDLERILNSIDHLTCLRALDLSWSRFSVLTDKIEKLTRLRYLNLSGNAALEILPEEVCDLFNLQSLDISGCIRLKELPHGMGKLINLVYLENEGTCLSFMPKGIERLTHLRTLKEFVARSGGLSCSLEGLGKLTHLQGRLKINGLGNIAESNEENKAILLAETGLRQLHLTFDCNTPEAKLGVESAFLEALQPPSCLEDLYIENFEGPPLLPNWMMPLIMLKDVILVGCANWETLPPLGKLRFLEQLVINRMHRVEKVGEEFLGIERETSSCSYICRSNNYIAFPKLYRLEFCDLPNWKEWEYGKLSTSTSAGGEAASSSCLTIMPCLEELIIDDCPLLKILPHHILHNPTVQLSDFGGTPIPKQRFHQSKGSREQRIITTSIIDESEVFAREEEKREMKQMLLRESSAETKNLCIISIVGMGGIGKTTLAQLAYNEAEVKSKFDVRIWVCVSEPFEEERIAVEILESLPRQKPNLVGRDNILQEISERVSAMKVLLVLDDVWTERSNDWEKLKASLQKCSRGSRILVTTRKQTVAESMGSRTMDMVFLSQLPDEKCWSLFSRLAFFDRTIEECRNLEDIGRKILRKCKGLPLAVKVVGGLLGLKETKEEWQCILDSEMWEIEEVEKGVFPPLFLSYYDLPPVLKQCFSYCAIFPKDHQIEKKKLIYLWMSQGFLKETQHKKMEVVGEEYFNKLAMLSFFQDFVKYCGNTIRYCKMHDIMHDFAQYLTARECLLMEIDDVESRKKPYFKSIHHLTMTGGNKTVGISMEDCKKLRTLSIIESGGLERTLNSIDHLICLRALDLSRSRFSMLTDKIGKLTQLRYLDLSGNEDLEILPKAVCDLCNLQSLDISGCIRLKELPHGMGKLINLVYLENEGTCLSFMPKGMQRLTRLRTLKEFVASSGGGSCSLEGLGKLTHLQGYLEIKVLGNIAKGREENKAILLAKTGIRRLDLVFEAKLGVESGFLEALQPPSCLENLCIRNFEGPPLVPNWMMSLKKVTLRFCAYSDTVPPFGKLPFLEELALREMDRVKKVGEEFLGIERETSSCSYIAFPKLKTLEFWILPYWEEWEYGKLFTSTSAEGEGAVSSSCLTIMPCLEELFIQGCPLLKILPHHILHNPKVQLSVYDGKSIPKQRFHCSLYHQST